MADVTTPHADLAEEFRALARAALERMEPLLRGDDTDAAADQSWQGCTWCPLCAAAALIKGERHPLLTVVAREGEHVLTALRALLREHAAQSHSAQSHPADTNGYAEHDHGSATSDGEHRHGNGEHRHGNVDGFGTGDVPFPGAVPDAAADHDPAHRPTSRPAGPPSSGPPGGSGYQPIEVTIDDGSAGI